MKKLLAILLSALMLCAMIPFATVAAADEPTIVVSTDAEEYNAGDEIEVTVELLNNPGVIAATVEILYDHDALELPAYYDEDEEMWLPQIEVGSKFSASSNKYITFGPIDEENGVAQKCVVSFIRGTATSNVTNELFFTATFKVKDNAVSGNYDLTISYDPENFFAMGDPMPRVDFGKQDTSIVINGADPLPPACEHEYDNACDVDCNLCGETREVEHNVAHVEAVAPTCYENGNIEYWYCETCGQAWLDEACTLNTNLMAVVLPMAHAEATHVEAVAPTCYENGNIEYWYCEACGQAWLDEACTLNTNLMAVVLPMAHAEATHVEAVAPTCYENGNIEYWYCEACGQAWLDEACTLNTNLLAVVLPMAHGEITHVAAKDATCTELGNIEYWYCEACGAAWLDEACTLNTNLMAVKLPMVDHEYFYACDPVCMNCYEVTNPDAAHALSHVEAKDATCTELGNIEYWTCEYCGGCWDNEAATGMPLNRMMVIVPMVDHEYFYACDPVCMNCYEVTNPDAAHALSHVEAKDATCTELGNIEYWTCEYCGGCWDNEAATGMPLNRMMVIVPMVDHEYNNAHDADCNVCGEIRDVVLSADEIILFGGNSVSEIRNGLAFKFDAAVNGIVWNEEYEADYSNATVIIDGVEYKLIGMGAIVNNKGESNLTLDDVDGIRVLNVEALKVFEDANGATSFAVRIINIPEANLDTVITAAPYYVYEADGETITVYGADVANSYNNVAN